MGQKKYLHRYWLRIFQKLWKTSNHRSKKLREHATYRHTPPTHIFNLLKIKEKILKALGKENWWTYYTQKEENTRITIDFSKSLRARNNIVLFKKCSKNKNKNKTLPTQNSIHSENTFQRCQMLGAVSD